MKPWKLAVDLDGVLAKSGPREKYPQAIPIRENIDKVNKLVMAGHTIFIYTARSWGDYDLTLEWLNKNGVKFNQLVCGKLLAHMYMDDLNNTLDGAIERLCESPTTSL